MKNIIRERELIRDHDYFIWKRDGKRVQYFAVFQEEGCAPTLKLVMTTEVK